RFTAGGQAVPGLPGQPPALHHLFQDGPAELRAVSELPESQRGEENPDPVPPSQSHHQPPTAGGAVSRPNISGIHTVMGCSSVMRNALVCSGTLTGIWPDAT